MLYLSQKFVSCYRGDSTRPEGTIPQLPTMFDRRCYINDEGMEFYWDEPNNTWRIREPYLTTPDPEFSGPNIADEDTNVNITITNYDTETSYNINVSHGTYSRSGDTITWSLPEVDSDTPATMYVSAREINKFVSNVVEFDLTIRDVPVTADQTLLYEGATMTSTEFPVTQGIDLSGNTLKATQNNAYAESEKTSQDSGDTDWHKATPNMDSVPVGYCLDASTTNTTAKICVNFVEYEKIPTHGGMDWKFFEIDGEYYLVIANYNDDSDYNVDSVVYKWNPTISIFEDYQTIPTVGAYDWKHFVIDGEHYLAVANYRNSSTYDIDSVIYKWNPSTSQFEPYQNISTHGAHSWEHFVIDGEHYLAVANYRDDTSHDTNSYIYKWNPSSLQFEYYQTIATHGAYDWEFFEIDGSYYLMVANYRTGSADYTINSVIYKWNPSTSQFESYQNISTIGAANLKVFQINGEYYLAIAHHYNGSTYNLTSKIYKWNTSTSQFEQYQDIATHGAADWEHFIIDNEDYLALANYREGTNNSTDSIIYKWNPSTTQFESYQIIPTIGAFDWEYFEINGEYYLGVANIADNSTYNVNSVIYKTLFPKQNETVYLNDGNATTLTEFTITSLDETSRTVDISGANLTNPPSLMLRDVARLSTSLVGTGDLDSFEERTIQTITVDDGNTPTKVTTTYDSDTRYGRDFKVKTDEDILDEPKRIEIVLEKVQ